MNDPWEQFAGEVLDAACKAADLAVPDHWVTIDGEHVPIMSPGSGVANPPANNEGPKKLATAAEIAELKGKIQDLRKAPSNKRNIDKLDKANELYSQVKNDDWADRPHKAWMGSIYLPPNAITENDTGANLAVIGKNAYHKVSGYDRPSNLNVPANIKYQPDEVVISWSIRNRMASAKDWEDNGYKFRDVGKISEDLHKQILESAAKEKL